MRSVRRWTGGVAAVAMALIAASSHRDGLETAVVTAAVPAVAASAERVPVPQAAPPTNAERNAYFGELHVHTSWSLDAFSNGDQRDDPAVAYRYGRGDALRNADGSIRAQLKVPLDFMAVTDHDAFLGESHLCLDPKDKAYSTQICKDLRAGTGTEAFLRVYMAAERDLRRNRDICGTEAPGAADDRCFERTKHVWREIEKTANDYYQPGKFTTFTAFEWTGTVQKTMGWLHRNVIFLGPKIPAWGGSSVDMKQSPERLWEWLERACTGECQVLAIPHNTNFGFGVVLAPNNSDGSPFTREIASRRAKLEPLIEIHQVKGNSECAPGLGTTDEECGFEKTFRNACKPGQIAQCAVPSDYVRNALKTGMAVEERLGVNPFKYGIISATDDHKSAPGSTDERTWAGAPFGELGVKTQPGSPNQNPGGLAGVWAEANTRESIFGALRRKETFGTSGSRIRMRMFGSWRFAGDAHTRPEMVRDAYRTGVPMGSDLPGRPANAAAPSFLLWAVRDPDSANLQRIQIVKGWTKGQETFEKVFDAICSDGLRPDAATHRCADNGARVDMASCSVSADKGAPELKTTWTDPEFDPAVRAFYYARVMENPTCRWSTWRAMANKTPLPADAPAVIQERAWGSPIWYTPAPR